MDELISLLEEKVSLLEEKDARIEKLGRVVQQLTKQNEKLKCINDCLLTRKSTATCSEKIDPELQVECIQNEMLP